MDQSVTYNRTLQRKNCSIRLEWKNQIMQRWLHFVEWKLCDENWLLSGILKFKWALHKMQPVLSHGDWKKVHSNILFNMYYRHIDWRFLLQVFIWVHFNQRSMLFHKAECDWILINEFLKNYKRIKRLFCVGKIPDCLPLWFKLC